MSKRDDQFQSRRFELKYFIEESIAFGVRDLVRGYLDRDGRTATDPSGKPTTNLMFPTPVFERRGVLELMFTGRLPDWFGDLVRSFGWTQCGAAKYADGGTRSLSNSKTLALVPGQMRHHFSAGV